MHNVVVVGDANVDIIVPYPRFLDAERTRVEYPTPELQGGGTSANTAVALAKLGVGTAFIGTVGDDQYGRFVAQDLASAGIDTSGLIVDPTLNTVGVFAFVDDRGERYLWGWPRVDQSFTVIDAQKVSFERVRKADWVHSSGMSLVHDTSARATIIRIFEEAHAAGVTTSFDLNLRVDEGVLCPKFGEALQRIIPHATYLLGSGPEEFAHLGGKAWLNNARALAVDGRTVVARDGANGSIGLDGSQEVIARAFPVTVEDTIGAGDVYNAGFISAILQGRTLAGALEAGNAVSAYTVERSGSRSSPNAQQLAEFLAQHQRGVMSK
ncbi:Fructoselysine 6-kinase [Pleomorphomonas sp. T1.2MG-36]|uniref:carbohydrate kinase family protein n=1 Tax=Pleomorphomonas sp. T1.2MG-36 TaxID=3041167 RepID=UPI00247740F1|nr:carbohydrate kinase family protein [Pleomorphomonas sp. T1.2MG-36]CAI9409426.1 Fructoselysine 6-kinase [Pleomorphomonas sp. T1.2MG-36]